MGWAVTTGDFNGDNYDDIAVGAPGENDGQGTVGLYYGSSSGIDVAAGTFVSMALSCGSNEADDRFGSALAAGDVNGDGYDELAIGGPGENGGVGVVCLALGDSTELLPGSSSLAVTNSIVVRPPHRPQTSTSRANSEKAARPACPLRRLEIHRESVPCLGGDYPAKRGASGTPLVSSPMT